MTVDTKKLNDYLATIEGAELELNINISDAEDAIQDAILRVQLPKTDAATMQAAIEFYATAYKPASWVVRQRSNTYSAPASNGNGNGNHGASNGNKAPTRIDPQNGEELNNREIVGLVMNTGKKQNGEDWYAVQCAYEYDGAVQPYKSGWIFTNSDIFKAIADGFQDGTKQALLKKAGTKKIHMLEPSEYFTLYYAKDSKGQIEPKHIERVSDKQPDPTPTPAPEKNEIPF